MSFFLALFFAFCYILSMANVFYAPTFFAKKMGVLTRQMAEYVDQYSRNVAPQVSESYINALYLPADAYDFVSIILERQYEALSTVPAVAARIASDFPSFVGDPGKTAETLLEFWAAHVGNAPDYVAQATTFGARQLENFPVIASQVWKIVKQGATCRAEIMQSWFDVLVGTDWDSVPANVYDAAVNYWDWIGTLPNPFDPPILVPAIRTPSTEIIPGSGEMGKPIPSDPNGHGQYSPFNGGVFGGLGGFAPPDYPDGWERAVCFAMEFRYEWHDSYTNESGEYVEISRGDTFTFYTLGGGGFPGMAGGAAGRNISGGSLIPSIPAQLLENPGLATLQRWDMTSFAFVFEWNPANNAPRGRITEYGRDGFFMTDYPNNGGFYFDLWRKDDIYTDTHQPIQNKWRSLTVKSFYTPISRGDAANFFGLPPFGWYIPPITGFPGGLPGLLMGGLMGGLTTQTTQTILANMLNMQSGGGRRDERRGN